MGSSLVKDWYLEGVIILTCLGCGTGVCIPSCVGIGPVLVASSSSSHSFSGGYESLLDLGIPLPLVVILGVNLRVNVGGLRVKVGGLATLCWVTYGQVSLLCPPWRPQR